MKTNIIINEYEIEYENTKVIVEYPENWDGKTATMLIFGIGYSAANYNPKRLAVWKEGFFRNGSAVITFNIGAYIEKIKSLNAFYSATSITNIANEVLNFFTNKYENTKVNVIGWSYGAASAFFVTEKNYEKINKVIFIVPTFLISVEFHAKRISREFKYENVISDESINYSEKEFKEFANEMDFFKSYNGSLKIYYAENDKWGERIIENSKLFLEKNNADSLIIPNANHSLGFHTSDQFANIEEENSKIWDFFLDDSFDFLFN